MLLHETRGVNHKSVPRTLAGTGAMTVKLDWLKMGQVMVAQIVRAFLLVLVVWRRCCLNSHILVGQSWFILSVE